MSARRSTCLACEKPVEPVTGVKVWRHIDGTGNAHPCPVCGLSAYLVTDLDRFMHANGSENVECWLAMSRGRLPGIGAR